MYLITFNSYNQRIEACLGGCPTSDEAKQFKKELTDMMDGCPGGFSVVVDLSTINSMTKNVEKTLVSCRSVCHDYHADRVTFITGDPDQAAAQQADRMKHVLEGTEQYLPYQRVS